MSESSRPSVALSVVIPVYNEEPNLPLLFQRLYPVLDGLGSPYEVIFTNDGSADRSLALLRAQRAGAVCVLGSATPSLKSFDAVQTGRLTRLVLPERAHRKAAIPTTEVIDLRRIGPARPGEKLLSLPLCRALEQVLQRKEQAILFLNRRGFAPSVA